MITGAPPLAGTSATLATLTPTVAQSPEDASDRINVRALALEGACAVPDPLPVPSLEFDAVPVPVPVPAPAPLPWLLAAPPPVLALVLAVEEPPPQAVREAATITAPSQARRCANTMQPPYELTRISASVGGALGGACQPSADLCSDRTRIRVFGRLVRSDRQHGLTARLVDHLCSRQVEGGQRRDQTGIASS